jgi:hypothetical protein
MWSCYTQYYTTKYNKICGHDIYNIIQLSTICYIQYYTTKYNKICGHVIYNITQLSKIKYVAMLYIILHH